MTWRPLCRNIAFTDELFPLVQADLATICKSSPVCLGLIAVSPSQTAIFLETSCLPLGNLCNWFAIKIGFQEVDD